jgi:hypothetical protein
VGVSATDTTWELELLKLLTPLLVLAVSERGVSFEGIWEIEDAAAA